MKNKYLVTIEFRFNDKEPQKDDYTYKNKTVTICILETIEEAIKEGNKALKELSKTFEIRNNDKFELNHLWGMPKTLVTNTCHSFGKAQFFAQITTLKFDNLNEVTEEIVKASKRYNDFKKLEQNY